MLSVKKIIGSVLLLGLFASLRGSAAGSGASGGMALGSADAAVRKQAILGLSASGDPVQRRILEDYRGGGLFVWQGRLVTVTETYENDDFEAVARLADALTREVLPGPGVLASKLTALSPGPQDYPVLKQAALLLALSDPDPAKRKLAIAQTGESGDWSQAPILEARLAAEADAGARQVAEASLRLLLLRHPSDAAPERLEDAIAEAGRLSQANALEALRVLQASPDPLLAKQAGAAAAAIESRQRFVRAAGHLFSGLSLGSILVLMALGLSVTFGLMRVINMAHGELMMLGAYTAYLMQRFFELRLPASAWNFYFLLALPAAFLVAALAGLLIERLVVRHLYGRPLETLLATWGVSLILIQSVRLAFGDNIAVNSPTWFQGGFEVLPGLVLAANRLFILLLCGACVVLTYGLMGRTRLGLLIRGATQNRAMAASLGVDTRRTDAVTFAFGSGLAGIAGCALTLIGGVTPNMGQTFIVDSFLVVVTGGVGKLAGALFAGLGLGVLNKVFEPFVAAVWAKVLILVCVVLFIQWKPSGLFPAKGRGAADAE